MEFLQPCGVKSLVPERANARRCRTVGVRGNTFNGGVMMEPAEDGRIALLLGTSESLQVRAAHLLETAGFFVFAAGAGEEARCLAAALPGIDLLIVEPGPRDSSRLEMIALCDERPQTRLIVMVEEGSGTLPGTNILTLPVDFRPVTLSSLASA